MKWLSYVCCLLLSAATLTACVQPAEQPGGSSEALSTASQLPDNVSSEALEPPALEEVQAAWQTACQNYVAQPPASFTFAKHPPVPEEPQRWVCSDAALAQRWVEWLQTLEFSSVYPDCIYSLVESIEFTSGSETATVEFAGGWIRWSRYPQVWLEIKDYDLEMENQLKELERASGYSVE